MPVTFREVPSWPLLESQTLPLRCLWSTVPWELPGAREGCFPKGTGAEQTKHRMSGDNGGLSGDTAVCPATRRTVCLWVSLTFLFLGPLRWGTRRSSSESLVVLPSKRRLSEGSHHVLHHGHRCPDHVILLLHGQGPKPSLILAVLF